MCAHVCVRVLVWLNRVFRFVQSAWLCACACVRVRACASLRLLAIGAFFHHIRLTTFPPPIGSPSYVRLPIP